MDDAYLREAGARAEGIACAGTVGPPDPSENAASTGPVTPALYVSPTSGQLSPGEESRVRLTFTPKRAGVLSFELPVWLAREPATGTRPYLTLHVRVSVCFGRVRKGDGLAAVEMLLFMGHLVVGFTPLWSGHKDALPLQFV